MRWMCRACGCLYAAGAPCCPACRATAHDEEAAPAVTEEDEVPKIDRFGVATIGPVTTGHASAILPAAGVPPVPAPAPEPEPEPAPEVPPAPAVKPAPAPSPAPAAKAAAPVTPAPVTPKKAGNG